MGTDAYTERYQETLPGLCLRDEGKARRKTEEFVRGTT